MTQPADAMPPRRGTSPTLPSRDEPLRQVRPPQFSMRTLLIVMTIAAVVVALATMSGLPFRELARLTLASPLAYLPLICFGSAAVYARGYRQTFCAGAFAAALIDPPWEATRASTFTGVLLAGVLQIAACLACGYVAVCTRRFVERRGWHRGETTSDLTPPR